MFINYNTTNFKNIMMIHVIDMKHHSYINIQSFVDVQKNCIFYLCCFIREFFEMVNTKYEVLF